MNSIGNDIVDLDFIDKARTNTRAFYSKILSETEQQLYQVHFNSIAFWQYVWLLWSCKEAVYKFAKRLQPDLVFSPVKIFLKPELKNEQNASFSLNFVHRDDQYHTSSIITDNYIATIANDVSDFSSIEYDIIQINRSDYDHQSAEVRKHFLERLNTLFPHQKFKIAKNETGYPEVLNNGVDTGLFTSFAHHGNYVAYALKTHNLNYNITQGKMVK